MNNLTKSLFDATSGDASKGIMSLAERKSQIGAAQRKARDQTAERRHQSHQINVTTTGGDHMVEAQQEFENKI